MSCLQQVSTGNCEAIHIFHPSLGRWLVKICILGNGAISESNAAHEYEGKTTNRETYSSNAGFDPRLVARTSALTVSPTLSLTVSLTVSEAIDEDDAHR